MCDVDGQLGPGSHLRPIVRNHFLGELRDMQQSVLLGPNVHENAEARRVGDDAAHLHSRLRLFQQLQIAARLGRLELTARIQAPRIEFLDDGL